MAKLSRFLGLALISSLLVADASSGAEEKPRAESESAALEKAALAILEKRCSKCHGARRSKGDLRLDGLPALRAGGESGKVVLPGRPEKSLLVRALRHVDDDLRMPPKRPLDPAEVEAVVAWIRSLPIEDEGEDAVTTPPDEPVETFRKEQRDYWFFQPLLSTSSLASTSPESSAHERIDEFVDRGLAEVGAQAAGAAPREVLVRRLAYQLTGLPPRPRDVREFVADEEPEAWEKLVDRLLAEPGYAERAAHFWLDLVRYAESNGYRADEYRPTAWRYRDRVVDAFLYDEPHDRFVAEQIAGDELAPQDPKALAATGYLRLWPYESNQKDVRGQWNAIIDDVTTVSGEVFLGLSMGCARCHDHKFDPILQTDYYAFRAYFAALEPRDDSVWATPSELAAHDARLAEWQRATQDLRQQIADIEREPYRKRWEANWSRFPEDLQPTLRADESTLDPLRLQLRRLADRQMAKEVGDVAKLVKGEAAARRKELLVALEAFADRKPPALPGLLSVSDIGEDAPRNAVPSDASARDISPALPSVLPAELRRVPLPEHGDGTTGRRSALAAWLTRDDNALVLRVITNRIWQRLFGRGLVETANDFGVQGGRPSHPELLDWLARRFASRGQSRKDLERSLLLSETWRRASTGGRVASGERQELVERLYARRAMLRLDADQLRDGLLAASGVIDRRLRGEGEDTSSRRRSLYLKRLRNRRPELQDVFDAPDGFNSCARREVTTTAPQALFLWNDAWSSKLARSFSEAVLAEEGAAGLDATLRRIWERAFARQPSAAELEHARVWVRAQVDVGIAQGVSHRDSLARGLTDLCHAFLNSNEFCYLD